MITMKYLKEVLQPTINQLTGVNKKVSLELDPNRLELAEVDDLPRHKALVIEHLNQLVDRIASPAIIEKIPIPIK